jgi:glutaconate CoA-transferase subunit A
VEDSFRSTLAVRLYEAWDAISRDRERFKEWMERHVLGTADFGEYLQNIRQEGAIRI